MYDTNIILVIIILLNLGGIQDLTAAGIIRKFCSDLSLYTITVEADQQLIRFDCVSFLISYQTIRVKLYYLLSKKSRF